MTRPIDADALTDRMYHDAFETDTDMQKWDSGCWIRYKMFENAIDEAPTIEPSGDLVSRQLLIGAIKKCGEEKIYPQALIKVIKALPSADVVSREEHEELYRKAEEVNGMANEILADFPSYKEPAPVVAYICDRRRCAICRGEDGGCDHTTDITHAAHFKNVAGQYFERPYMEEDDG